MNLEDIMVSVMKVTGIALFLLDLDRNMMIPQKRLE